MWVKGYKKSLHPELTLWLPFPLLWRMHMLCVVAISITVGLFCQLLHPRREEGRARAHSPWKHGVAGTVCSVGGDQLWHKPNLRLLLIAIFEYPTAPSKQICSRHNVGIALWEISSFNWDLLGYTNPQFHSPQHPPSLLPSHTGTRMTCILELSS